MARKQPVDIKEFRHGIALLKKAGLVRNIDARSAQPYFIRQGNRLSDLIKKYDDVISGKMTPVSLSSKKVKEYRDAGYEVRKGPDKKPLVMIPKSKTEKVSVTKTGDVEVKHPSGISRIKQAVPFHNLPQWLRGMEADYKRIDRMKSSKEFFGYKYFGFNSYALYRDIRLLIDDLVNGSASGLNLMDKARESTRKQQNEIYQNLEIVRVPTNRAWKEPEMKHGKTTAAARKRYRQRIKGKLVGERAKAADAEQHRKWRAELSPAEKKKYKEAARKRAAKSQAKETARKRAAKSKKKGKKK